LVGGLLSEGIIDGQKGYEDYHGIGGKGLFEGVTFNKADLRRVRAETVGGNGFSLILDPGLVDAGQLFNMIFINQRIPRTVDESCTYGDLGKLLEIDPRDIPRMEFHLEDDYFTDDESGAMCDNSARVVEAFKVAHDRAQERAQTQKKTKSPRILFTPYTQNPSANNGLSMLQVMKNRLAGKGEKVLDPIASILNFRGQMDAMLREMAQKRRVDIESRGSGFDRRAGLLGEAFYLVNKSESSPLMPNNERVETFPGHVFPNGETFGWMYDTGSQTIVTLPVGPLMKFKSMANRIALG
jgi:hypothetical protein